MGIDFGLLSADSRPLTAKQLTAILGRDASFGDRRGAYQDAVDTRLFGLGRERYTQLLDLLIALRRPLLAKDLDPVKVSATLSAGLSPVDEDLVEQAARDFENLAAVQKQYDDLAAADAAVRAFLTQYTAYLRAHTRHQADQLTARITAAAGHVAAIITAAGEAAAAGRQEQQAKEAGESARISVDTFQARLSALKDRDAYKDHEKLALRRSQLEAGQDPARPGSSSGWPRPEPTSTACSRRPTPWPPAGTSWAAPSGGTWTRLTESAAGAGLLRDGEPADTGADLAMTAKARVTARRDDIAEVRARLASVREAGQARTLAETELGKARQALDDCDQACRVAEQGLAAARADVAGQLRTWATRWAGDQPSAILDEPGLGALEAALGRAGEPDAATLTETFTTLTQPRADTLISRREQLTSAETQLAAEQEARTTERHKIASEHDDAPPASDLRPAARAGRPRRAALAAGPVRRRAHRRGRRRDRGRAVRGGPADRLDPSRPGADLGGGRGGGGRRVSPGRTGRGAAPRPDPGRRARPRTAGSGPPGRGGGSAAVGCRCGRSFRWGTGAGRPGSLAGPARRAPP